MKKLILLILIAFAIIACNDNLSIVDPDDVIGMDTPHSFYFCILYPFPEEYSKTDTMHVEVETDVKRVTQVQWDFPIYSLEDFSYLLIELPKQGDSASKFHCKAIISNSDIPSWENRVDTLLIDYDKDSSIESSPFKIQYNGNEMENLVEKESDDPWFYVYEDYDVAIRIKE